MPRARDPNRDKAFMIFKESNGDITNRKIAEMLDCPEKSIGGWKSKDKWNQKLNGVLHSNERSTPNKTKAKKSLKKEKVESEIVVSEDNDLTDKQRLFVAYYLKCWNATKAYQKAYGCAYSTALTNGSALLKNTRIRQEVVRVRDEITGDALLSKRVLIQKWLDILFADITDFVTFGKREQQVVGMYGPLVDKKTKKPIMETVNYLDVKESVEVDGSIITEIKQGKDGISVKLADKMKALEYLSKHVDLLNENELKQLKSEQARMNIEKTKTDIERNKIAIRKENGEDDEFEDDGFLEALDYTAADVWKDEENE